jgi:hypothetical protein
MAGFRTSAADAAVIAEDGFVFGYPLVLMEHERISMTAVEAPDPARMLAPLNRFVHARTLPGTVGDAVTGPHTGNLRSSAWLDLDEGPLLLSVPDTHGRYYRMAVVDAWTNVVASIGPRTTGSRSGSFAICGPRCRGSGVPSGVQPVRAPTRFVRIAAGTQVDPGRGCAEAHAVQDAYELRPLNAPRASCPPSRGPVATRSWRPPPAELLERMPPAEFFRTLARLMRDNPPRAQDRLVVDPMRELGLLHADGRGIAQLDRDLRRAVELGARRGLALVLAGSDSPPGEAVGQWRVRFDAGRDGISYLSRAGAACAALEPGPAEDELPILACRSADGRPLSGRHRYALRFPAHTPSVHGFWTLTTYDDRQPLVDNPVDAYSIGDWNGLTLDGDGSLVIHIHHCSRRRWPQANWLPAPPGRFNLLLRLHWPEEAVFERGWAPPTLTRVS